MPEQRQVGPLANPLTPHGLMNRIAYADRVDIVFSDGEHEIASLQARSMPLDAFVLPFSETVVRLSEGEFIVEAPASGPAAIVGVGLVLDYCNQDNPGQQVAWCQFAEVIEIAASEHRDLKGEIGF